MTPWETTWARKLVFLVAALAPALYVLGCAKAPLASHGTDDNPAFDAPNYGDVGIERGFLSGPRL